MHTPPFKRSRGFVLIEALIALLIVSIGLLAISKLETFTISAAGEARSRSEAVTLAQKKLEELRNWVVESAFTAGVATGGPTSYTGSNATYSYSWTVTPTAGGSLVQLTTTWTDRFGNPQKLDLNTLVSWDDPYNQLKGEQGFTGTNAPSPSGEAKRGTTNYGNNVPQGATTNTDGSGTKTYVKSDNSVELIDSTGKVVLYLDPTVNGQSQSFTTIKGRIYFDQNAGNNSIPNSSNVRIRLSSEGQCFYDNTTLSSTATYGSNSYKYFAYVCYVGPKWWGNVGVVVDDSVNGQAGNPTICVGDPSFNSGVSDSTLISAHPVESSVRSYRGFWDQGVNATPRYLTTGMQGGTTYPYDVVNSSVTARGKPQPSNYPSYYPTVTAGGATDYFDQNFLITHISGQASCYSKMQGGAFTRNAGAYFCIAPDDDSAHSDACPSIWPGFEGAVGSGGQINYTISLTKAGSGTGSVSSTPAGVTCDVNCTSTSGSFATGTTVTLTANPAGGSVFTGWGGACSGTGSCVVTLSGATAVTATFSPGTTTYNLGVTMTGSGTVTSDSGGINCPVTCTGSYNANTLVTLTSTPTSGYTFTGWGGACSGTSSTCSVTMDAAKSVSVTYTLLPVPYVLTLNKSVTAGGTVTSSPSGISCGTGCSTATSTYASGTTVTLTASAASGYQFTGWSGGGCSGTGTCVVTMSSAQSVTASFGSLCTTPITGTAHDKFGSVSVTSPSGAGTCAMNGGNSAGYSCSLSTVAGTIVTLNNAKTTGNANSQYSYALNVTANCAAQTNVNFP